MAKKVVFISGRICSGKDTYAAKHYSGDKDEVMGTSTALKRVLKLLGQSARGRKELQDTKDYADLIADQILSDIIVSDRKEDLDQETFETYVVTGCRQKKIYDRVKAYCDEYNVDVENILLNCPTELRKIRYEERDRDDETDSFEVAEDLDDKLGLSDWMDYLWNEAEGVKVVNTFSMDEIDIAKGKGVKFPNSY